MCKRFMVVILVLGVLFAPAVAFADDFGGSDGGDFSDRVIYGPNVLNIQSGIYGVQVYAGNKFNAALCVLGFDGSDSRFTNDVKAYLSNESTGGSFYEFSNLFTNNNSPSISGFDVYNITFTSAIGTNNMLYGAEFVWIAQYTDALRQAAYARVEEVLNGNVGGGGSGGIDGDYLVFTGNYKVASGNNGSGSYSIQASDGLYYTTNGKGHWDNNVWVFEPLGNGDTNKTAKYFTMPLTVKLDSKILNNPPDNFENSTLYMLIYNNRVNVMLLLNCTNTLATQNNNLSNAEYVNGVSASSYYDLGQYTLDGTNKKCTVTGSTFTLDYLGGSKVNINNNSISYNMAGVSTIYLPFGGGSLTPVVPPTQWPEPEPVTPTEPPEVPSPTPTDPPTDPTTPQFGIPQLPSIGLTTEPTYQTADLTAVLDAMAKHCQHLQTCMTECFDSYYSAITQYEKSIQENQKEFLRSWFRVTLDTIRDCFDDLSDYLQRLFTWLADQMDFTFTGGDYDDSSILWWLKRIYSKLGSGTTVRPTDPVVDPKGIGDWFDQLIKNFVLDLLALGQDFLADVVEMFRQLTTKFPISIPWDIVAILTLFAAEPETPVLNIPQYALTGVNTISQVGTYVIDLQDYDGVMSVVRNVEKVVFAFWLCWKIDFFKQAFDIMTGGK